MDVLNGAYTSSLIGLLVLVLILLYLSLMVGPGKGKAGVIPGGEPQGGYDDLLYRQHRAHLNAVESMAAFAPTLLAAMFIGASPAVVVWLTWLHVLARIAYTVVYLRRIGAPTGGPRSIIYGAGWLMNLLLALYVLAVAIF